MSNFKMKKFFAAGVAVLALSALSITAFAASAYNNPAEAAAALTGQTVESVVDQRQETGDSYCTIAEEAGVLDEYKAAVLEMKKDVLDARVAAGTMTQERADEIMAALAAADCDGSCDNSGAGLGQSYGVGFGFGNGDGTGSGLGNGNGFGNGNGDGTGNGTCDGDCTADGLSDGTGNQFGGQNGGQNGLRTQLQDDSCVVNG